MSRASSPGALQAVSVLPDVTGVDRLFTYQVPQRFQVTAGMIVRVPLAGRKVRGWVVDDDVVAPEGVVLKAIEGVVSYGLRPDLIILARFAQWRYAGRLRSFLLAGSPDRVMRPEVHVGPEVQVGPDALVDTAPVAQPPVHQPSIELDAGDPTVCATRDLVSSGGGLLQLPPALARLTVVETVIDSVAGRDLLVLVPERRDAERLARQLGQHGYITALLPEAWPSAYHGGCVVIGTRTAVFGPVADLGAVVVFDVHSESYVEQRAPTWNAFVLASERARLCGVPCIGVSPCPPLVFTHSSTPVALERWIERANWPATQIIDRRSDDPRSGLYAPVLGEIIRGALANDDRPVACVLHRSGRLRLLACGACGELARCTNCGGATQQLTRPVVGEVSMLTCVECAQRRPVVCASCHGTTLKTLRVGAGRAAEELSALVGVPTTLVEGGTSSDLVGDARVIVGTEAVLHRVPSASVVVFLDFDQHLLAPRFAANEEALALVARAGRLVGARQHHGTQGFVRRLVLQTRIPDHEVLKCATDGDPTPLRVSEAERRLALGLPPYSAIALVSGEATGDLVHQLGENPSIEIAEFDEQRATAKHPASTRYIVRAATHHELCSALEGAHLRGAGLRIEVDPSGI